MTAIPSHGALARLIALGAAEAGVVVPGGAAAALIPGGLQQVAVTRFHALGREAPSVVPSRVGAATASGGALAQLIVIGAAEAGTVIPSGLQQVAAMRVHHALGREAPSVVSGRVGAAAESGGALTQLVVLGGAAAGTVIGDLQQIAGASGREVR